MTMRLSVMALIALLLSGCSGLDAFRSGIADHGAEVSDRALVDAQWLMCNAVSVGAWRRAFGNSPEKAAAWRTLCAETMTQTP